MVIFSKSVTEVSVPNRSEVSQTGGVTTLVGMGVCLDEESEMAFGYVENRVMTGVDYRGTEKQFIGPRPTRTFTRPTWVPPKSDVPREVVPVPEGTNSEMGEALEACDDLARFALRLSLVLGLIFTPTRTAGPEADMLDPETTSLNLDFIYNEGSTLHNFDPKCVEGWKMKAILCGQRRACSGTDCNVINQNLKNGWKCASQRLRLMRECGKKDDRYWMCSHVAAYCDVISGMRNCAQLANSKCGGGFITFVQNAHDCKRWQSACKGAKSLKGNDIPWPVWR